MVKRRSVDKKNRSKCRQGANTSLHRMISDGHQLPKKCDASIILMPSIHAEALAVDENLQNQQSVPHKSEELLFPNTVPEPALGEEPAEAVLVARPTDFFVSAHTDDFFVGSDLKDIKKNKRRSRKSNQIPSVGEIDLDASISQGGANTSPHHMMSDEHQMPKKCDADIILMPSMHAKALSVNENLQNQQSIPHESEKRLYLNSVPELALDEDPAEAVLVAQPVDFLVSTRTEDFFVGSDLKDSKKNECRSTKSKQRPSVGKIDLDASTSQGANTFLHHMMFEGHQLRKKCDVGIILKPSIHAKALDVDENLQSQQSVPHESEDLLYLNSVPEAVFVARPVDFLVSTRTEDFFVGSDLKDSKKNKRQSRKSKQRPSMGEIDLDASTSQGANVKALSVNENLQNQQSIPHESEKLLYPNSVPEPAFGEEPDETVLVARPVDFLVSTRTEDFFVGSDLKDSKKNKRRSRKSKQRPSVGEIDLDESTSQGANTSPHHKMSEGHQLRKKCDVGIILKPSIHAKALDVDENLQSQQSVPHESVDLLYLNSVPAPALGKETVEAELVSRPVDYPARRKYFPPYWSTDAISEALEKGELLRAVFRVNAHNRLEAYCKIDGADTDVLINGVVAQNRAIDGDTVAIAIEPPSVWPRMKGLNETTSNAASDINYHEGLKNAQDCSSGKCNVDVESENEFSRSTIAHVGGAHQDSESLPGEFSDYGYGNELMGDSCVVGCQLSTSDASMNSCLGDAYGSRISLEKLCALSGLLPSKRPTGTVVAIIERSIRREKIVGFLSVDQWIYSRESKKRISRKNKNQSDFSHGFILLTPTDPKFTEMMVSFGNLPASVRKRLEAGDSTTEYDLVAVKVVGWAEDSYIPDARVVQVFGRGSDIEAQIAAILFENAIDASEFSSEVLACLPCIPWEVPMEELQSRKDLRNLCIFTIDPSNATDLDDALSVELLPNGNIRVGVHIADVSYFVLPDTALDIDSKMRSSSVYLLLRKLPMMPPILSDNLASLNPGVDRLTFSIIWDMNSEGEVLEHWIGRTIIQSCCKLSYEHAQEIIDGLFDFRDCNREVKPWPVLYGQNEWSDVIKSVNMLHEISRILRKNRFESGALSPESPKKGGIPYDTVVSKLKGSHCLVEEFMFLANKTAAEVISRTYPSCALLRNPPEPNARKLGDFQAFCNKHGLQLDISSSASFHHSLERIRGEVGEDSVLFGILMSYAARPMQPATYFCVGESKDTSSHGHYALAVPLHTHFTSPLRRYPDVVVHRTLAAALEAEDIYLEKKRMLRKIADGETLERCFTCMRFHKDEIESVEAQEALSAAASKHGVSHTENLADVAAHCNAKKLATRHVKDATDKLCMWLLLKKKQILFSKATVLALGPRFMSIYIPMLAVERRIYYDEVDGLTVEWLEATSTLVLSQSHKRSRKKSSPGKRGRAVDEVALLVNPADLKPKLSVHLNGEISELQTCGDITEKVYFAPAFFPLTLHLQSTIPVALHAVGWDDGSLDVVARMFVCSYFH